MRVFVFVGLLMAAMATMAQTSATAFITWTQNGSVYNYDITMQNTGTTDIGTLWYSWLPGQDFMLTSPSATSGPAGWNGGAVVHGGSNDGYSVQWIASTPLAPGQALDGFHFSSTDTPSMLAGNSHFFPNTPVGTTEIYQGGPFTGGRSVFVILPQPLAVNPSAYNVTHGNYVSGQLSDLFVADNSYLTFRSFPAFTPLLPELSVVLTGTSPTSSPGDLRFVLKSHVNTINVAEKIELFDYVANGWVQVGSANATMSDSVLTGIATNPARFVQSGTNQMQARLSYKETGPTFSILWLAFLDQAVWSELP